MIRRFKAWLAEREPELMCAAVIGLAIAGLIVLKACEVPR